jgi:glutathione synthase/RimK-type ligase-like ATP-grasp enzyme
LARTLTDFAEVRVVTNRLRNSNFAARDGDFVINWGCLTIPTRVGASPFILNHPHAIRIAGDKLKTYVRWSSDLREYAESIPAYTTDIEEAQEWREAGSGVLARQSLRAHSGAGITLVTGDDELPEAPLYVKYYPKRHEYRYHVVAGEVVLVQQKRKRREVPNEQCDYQIRNARNGWVYAINDIVLQPPFVGDVARAAVATLGLDFGAVDLGINERTGRVHLYEVNTAPGLSSPTALAKYASNFLELIDQQR